ncbi:MAG: DUF4870 domain-containing protein [Pseudonocardia sp.]
MSYYPPPTGPSVPPPPAGGPYGLSSDERLWAMLAHLGCLIIGLITGGFLAWLAPLIVMLTKGNESAFVRRHAVESLNFQITMIIVWAVAVVLTFVLIGFFVLLAQAVFWLIVVIMASVAANNGQEYRYPLTIRMVS